jgi:hypothetical protein
MIKTIEFLENKGLKKIKKGGKKKWGQIFILDFTKKTGVIHKLRPGKVA